MLSSITSAASTHCIASHINMGSFTELIGNVVLVTNSGTDPVRTRSYSLNTTHQCRKFGSPIHTIAPV